MWSTFLGIFKPAAKEKAASQSEKDDVVFSDKTIEAGVHIFIERIMSSIKTTSDNDKRFVEQLKDALFKAGKVLQSDTANHQRSETEKILNSLFEGKVHIEVNPSNSVDWLQGIFFELTCLHIKPIFKSYAKCLDVIDNSLCSDSACINTFSIMSAKARKKVNNFDEAASECGLVFGTGGEGLLFDTSIWGTGKTGFCLNESYGICSIESSPSRFVVRWSDLNRLYFDQTKGVLSVNGKDTFPLSNDNAKRQLQLVCDEFRKIKESFGHKVIATLGLEVSKFNDIVHDASPLAKKLYEATKIV